MTPDWALASNRRASAPSTDHDRPRHPNSVFRTSDLASLCHFANNWQAARHLGLTFDSADGRKTLKNRPFREYPVFVNCVKPEVLLFFPVSLKQSRAGDPIERIRIDLRRGTASVPGFRRRTKSTRQDEARMRTKSRSRARGLVLAVLTLIVSMPELAHAQQSGLFPLAPIKRQRIPCDQEDPVYKIYKEKYFGYHPACWRPFPTGWGCPSPEKPDVEKSFRERKLGTAEGTKPGGAEEMPARATKSCRRGRHFPLFPVAAGRRSTRPANGDRPANPAAPRQDQGPASPFDLDDRPANRPGAAPGTAGRGAPARRTPLSVKAARNSRLPTSPFNPPERGPAGSRATNWPIREKTTDRCSLSPTSRCRRRGSDTPFGSQPAQLGNMSADAVPLQSNPSASAPRRGFLSGLFNNLGLNWTRR